MEKLKNSFNALRTVFRLRTYLTVAILGMVLFVLVEMWLASYMLILFVWRGVAFGWQDRLSILVSAVTAYVTTFSWPIQLAAFTVASLVGINLALVIYYFQERYRLQSALGTGAFGAAMSLIGVGCASCGSVILSSLLGFTVATNLIATLPLRGQEFSLFAIAVLLFSIYVTAKKISDPGTCKIKT